NKKSPAEAAGVVEINNIITISSSPSAHRAWRKPRTQASCRRESHHCLPYFSAKNGMTDATLADLSTKAARTGKQQRQGFNGARLDGNGRR
ncbi:hypothetical protein, partial [Labrys sp. WJW]|uniref:hypothetical protein n=1 Tax=Labrys sp. WJW TaxID=1737983 RepID=UPI001AEC7FA0